MITTRQARLNRRAFVGLIGAFAIITSLPSTAATPLQIWFIRHGESELNVPGNPRTVPDSGVSYPLTRRGMEQARALAESLQGAPITKIYSSTHLRAIQTADAVAFAHTLPLSLAPEAVEIDLGIAPESTQDVRAVYGELTRKWFIEKDLDARNGSGESFADAGSEEPARAGLRHRRDRRAQRHLGPDGAGAGEQRAGRFRPAPSAAEHRHHQNRAARQPTVLYRLGRHFGRPVQRLTMTTSTGDG